MDKPLPLLNQNTIDMPKVPIVLRSTPCEKHGAPLHVPCFWAWQFGDDYKIVNGICNERAIAAGMNNPIDPRSLFRE